MKTIAIYHNKGGVGKTTTAVNLAAAFSNKNKRVLLIDIDAQANSTFATGLIKFQFEEDDNLKDRNVLQILSSGEFDFIPEIARKSKGFNIPEIDVVPSHITLIDEQDRLNRISAVPFRLTNKLQQVEDRYDIVIIDAPPSRDLYAQIALISADFVIIPSDMKPFSNQGLTNVKNFIREINETRSTISKDPLEVLGVLASKILTNPKYVEFVFPKQKEAVLQRYQLPMLQTIIYERVALSHCVNQTVSRGDLEIPDPKSVFEFDRDGDSVKEFRNLSSEVMQKIGL
ncbi:AAA family ATPase [Roseofilum reptotaenium CS-1145]|uniref:Cobyrinic acid a,c-diamide synthase n=1 Tax=Roseofilum reptotaenium AO1-A TaxID=1925591 RepID=A0A1L9QVY1_9CYAN|nr:AAA family ATPase [Roseofilum reptotaenium]MDB9518080.1 AAA family ATPase [Roseofilum reptotaenium CS-1145]OJJ26838.1 cobyrinic acid a,c-diamide synthase [Roseofilum reptotaenium AO1-A]